MTAERFDLAILAARAFDLRAGQHYLMLSGTDPALVQAFIARFPGQVRKTMRPHRSERRQSATESPQNRQRQAQ